MTIYDALKAWLRGQNLAVGQQVYFDQAPAGTAAPYVVIDPITVVPNDSHEGRSVTVVQEIQISVFTATGSQAVDVFDDLFRKLAGFKGTMSSVAVQSVFLINGPTLREDPDTTLRHLHCDFEFTYVDEA